MGNFIKLSVIDQESDSVKIKLTRIDFDQVIQYHSFAGGAKVVFNSTNQPHVYVSETPDDIDKLLKNNA